MHKKPPPEGASAAEEIWHGFCCNSVKETAMSGDKKRWVYRKERKDRKWKMCFMKTEREFFILR